MYPYVNISRFSAMNIRLLSTLFVVLFFTKIIVLHFLDSIQLMSWQKATQIRIEEVHKVMFRRNLYV